MTQAAQSGLRDLLAHQPFLRFWLARLAGILANQMLMVAVAWHMYELTGSAWDLGLVGLFQFVPALIFTLPAGHIVDRFHKVHIYAACMLVQTAVASSLVWGTHIDAVNREWVLLISVVLGVVRSFQMPTQQALAPLLVPAEILPRALAFSSGGMQMAIIGGPALGSPYYARHGAADGTVLAIGDDTAGARMLIPTDGTGKVRLYFPSIKGSVVAGAWSIQLYMFAGSATVTDAELFVEGQGRDARGDDGLGAQIWSWAVVADPNLFGAGADLGEAYAAVQRLTYARSNGYLVRRSATALAAIPDDPAAIPDMAVTG